MAQYKGTSKNKSVSEIRTHTNQPKIKSLENYVTTKQAAEILGVGQRHILHLLTIGKLQGTKLGHDWIVYYPSLNEYHGSKSTKGRPASGSPNFKLFM